MWLQLGAKHGEYHVRQLLFGLQPDTWNGAEMCWSSGGPGGMLMLDGVFGRISEKGNGKARLKVSCGQSEDQPKRFAARTVAARSHTEPQGGEQGCG